MVEFDNIAALCGKVLDYCNKVEVAEGDKIRLVKQQIWQITDSSVEVYDLKLERCKTRPQCIKDARPQCIKDAIYTWSDDHRSVITIPFLTEEGKIKAGDTKNVS